MCWPNFWEEFLRQGGGVVNWLSRMREGNFVQLWRLPVFFIFLFIFFLSRKNLPVWCEVASPMLRSYCTPKQPVRLGMSIFCHYTKASFNCGQDSGQLGLLFFFFFFLNRKGIGINLWKILKASNHSASYVSSSFSFCGQNVLAWRFVEAFSLMARHASHVHPHACQNLCKWSRRPWDNNPSCLGHQPRALGHQPRAPFPDEKSRLCQVLFDQELAGGGGASQIQMIHTPSFHGPVRERVPCHEGRHLPTLHLTRAYVLVHFQQISQTNHAVRRTLLHTWRGYYCLYVRCLRTPSLSRLSTE